jgi:hypothetical protein
MLDIFLNQSSTERNKIVPNTNTKHTTDTSVISKTQILVHGLQTHKKIHYLINIRGDLQI